MSSSTARRTWAPEGFGDLLGGGDGFLEQDRQPLGRVTADDVLTADQGQEGVPGARLLDPGQRIDDAGCRHRALAGADQSPPAAVGDDADLDLVLAQQRFDPVDGRRGPQVVRGLAQANRSGRRRARAHRSPSAPIRAAWAVTVTARLGDCAWTPGTSPHDSDSAHPATSRRTVSTHLSRATR